ncbi:MAG: hypothetical protein RR403_04220 [Pseudoflavonifractor sp.]
MLAKSHLLLAVSPQDSRVALTYGLPVAHGAYRVGGGPHLFRASMPVAVRGGLMIIDDGGFDGLGDGSQFCREVIRECLARNFDGVICHFGARPLPILGKIVSELGEMMAKRGWPLYVTEPYARFSEKSKVLISSALSGGSLRQRLGEAVNAYGPERVALSVERVAEDFFLPSPTGQGAKLSREELARRIEELAPSIFFSSELCAHYFTYMSPSGAHFILFDDGGSIRKKLQIARSMDISDAILPFAQVSDLLPELLR